jgi:chloramphenicol 3-O phosphotransferase
VASLPAYLVGVRCSLGVIMDRRRASGMVPGGAAREGVPEPVRRWQAAVHEPGIYDLEVDTTGAAADACAEAIRRHIEAGGPPAAFRRLAAT